MKIKILISLILITSIILLSLSLDKMNSQKTSPEGYEENMCNCPCCMARLRQAKMLARLAKSDAMSNDMSNECQCPCPMCRRRNCPLDNM